MIAHILIIISSIILFHIIGLILFNYFSSTENDDLERFTKSTILGLIITIVIYSFIKTEFVTINFLFLVISLIYLTHTKNKWKKEFKLSINIKYLTLCVSFVLLFLMIQYFNKSYFSIDYFDYGVDDYYYYNKTAEFIRLTGVEGRNFPSILDYQFLNQYRTPYHYFDIWIISLFQEFNLMSNFDIYQFVFSPLVFTLSFMCFYTFISKLNFENKILVVALTFLSIFFTGYIPIKNLIDINLFTQPRIYCAVIFTILFLNEYIKKHYFLAFIWLAFMPICNILAAPPILTFIFIYGAYQYFKGEKKNSFFYFFLSLILLVGFTLFYLVFGNLNGNVNSGNQISFSLIFKNFIFIFFRENLFRLPFYYCLFIIPIILLISFKKIYILLRKNLIVIFPIFLLIMLPIFYGSLFNFNIDSGGIMYFPKAIAITCFILYFVSKVEKNKMGFLIGTFILQASFIFFDNINPNSLKMDHPKISKEFISQIDKKINSGDWGVVIKNMDNAVVWDYNPYTLRKFHFIQLLNKQIGIINISDMNMKEGLGLSKSLISQGEFESYKPVEKVNGDFYKKQLDFIKQKNINFIITDELQMKNPYIKPIIIDSLIDKLTKYKIYFLK